jgi:GcrA cell cycle regulator
MRDAAWSNERIERLKLLWAGGASAQKIATQLGCVSRSAVLGKIFRLRLDSAAAALGAPPADNVVADDSRVAQSLTRRRARGRRADASPQIDASPLRTFGKSLLELTNECCRWPQGRLGTRGFFFCGAPGADLERGKPYCACHARRAYQARRARAEATKNLRRIARGEAPPICAAAPSPSSTRRYVWRGAVRHAAPRWR